jgi:hypothetical protein
MQNTVTALQLKNGATIPDAPIYQYKPYVLLGVRGDSKDVVLAAGTYEHIQEVIRGSYYDDCIVDIRRHNLAYNDNSLAAPLTEEQKQIADLRNALQLLLEWNTADICLIEGAWYVCPTGSSAQVGPFTERTKAFEHYETHLKAIHVKGQDALDRSK